MKKILFLSAVLAAALTASAENYILYTSSDGKVIEPKTEYSNYGANIVSNTCENGQGKILFDGEVKEIGDLAFSDCNSLTSVVIPNSVTTISNFAFFRYVSNKPLITITTRK